MAEVNIKVGERSYTVECDQGEEDAVQSAAKDFDAEAQSILGGVGKVPEAKLLLMAGLMLGGRLKAQEKNFHNQNQKVQALEGQVQDLKARINNNGELASSHIENSQKNINFDAEKKCADILISLLGELENLIEAEPLESEENLNEDEHLEATKDAASNQTELF